MIYIGFLLAFLLGFYFGFLACAIFSAGKIRKASMGRRRMVTIMRTHDVTAERGGLTERNEAELVEDRREADQR
jgi:hypothetical protein